ncbi:hypothetical protein QR680_008502 [Steinernema hermaphroditum]|uniref:Serpentine receptor class gamma n=1 Tax=Steinernema hermaphroditum TaxID=289476 RepID=A0AA39IGT9_9BILA|nr:hypothetical protein QR680_008502 [Steinernema hermaphroditum]
MKREVIMLCVSLLYGIPSFLLYLIVLVQLIRPTYRKRFNNPFFRLCFLIGVVDCIGYLDYYLFFTLPAYSLFSSFYGSSLFSPSAFTTAIYFSNYLFSYLQLFGNCFLTVNRFTCIVFPLKHNRIWKYFFPLSVVITDCFGYLDFYIFMTLPTYSFFSSFYGSSLFYPSAFTTAIYFSTYLFTYLQLFGNCFLTFNRFTCIVFPLKHNRIWRYCLPISIAVTVLSALIPWHAMNTELALLTLSLLYGIPSFLLYVVILFQLVRPKYRNRFSNPFFRLCFLMGVVDCVGYLIFYIFFTLPIYSMFSSFYGSALFFPSPFTTAVYFSAHLNSNIQIFGNCFLTLNRFTAIVFPLKHDKIWDKCFLATIVVSLLAAVAPIWQLSSTAAWYTPLHEELPERGFAMTLDNYKYPDFSLSFHMFLSNIVACTLCLFMNVVSAVVLIYRHAMNTEVALLTLSLLYGIPSFLLYVVILFQFVRPKYRNRFSNPFFRLCFLMGVVDCVGYLIFYIFFTLPIYSMFSSFYGSALFFPSPFTTAVYFSAHLNSNIQIFGNCFLTLNRFTAIVLPLKHDKIWDKCFLATIVVSLLAAIAPIWQLSSTAAWYTPLHEEFPERGFAMTLDNYKYPDFSLSFHMFLSNIVACTLCLFMNVVSAVVLIYRTSQPLRSQLPTMNTELVWLTVSLLYGIPSFVLYVVILFQLVRPKYRKQFNKPFFRLCFLIGVVDCLAYLMSYIFYTLPTYPLFSSFYGSSIFAPSPFTTFIQFFSYYLIYLQLFGNFFLTLNLLKDSVMEVELIKLTISLLYGIPSFVLYIVILIQIVRPKYRKTFSNAFFRLFSAIGFVDCLGYLTYYTFFTLPMYSITSPIFGSSLFAPSAFTTGIYFSLFMSGYSRPMEYAYRFVRNAKYLYNTMNPANLSGAIDVIVVEQPDGAYLSTPIHCRFGKIDVFNTDEKYVDITINGKKIDLRMKLGEDGAAVFVETAEESDKLKKLDLKFGSNEARFSVTTTYQGTSWCSCHIYLYRWNERLVISDIDGTITKSDVLGHVIPAIGGDWAHAGVVELYTRIKSNGYNLIYLSSRAIGQSHYTKKYLQSVDQAGEKLPDGPVLLCPDSIFVALRREVIERKPDEFKIAALTALKSLFPVKQPFAAGFGNRDTDVKSYTAVGIKNERILIINPQGNLKRADSIGYESSYESMAMETVDYLFPPLIARDADDRIVSNADRSQKLVHLKPLFTKPEKFSSFTHWYIKPRETLDLTDADFADYDADQATNQKRLKESKTVDKKR